MDPESLPAELVEDGVAKIAHDGTLQASNDAMRRWLQEHDGAWQSLSAAQQQRLQSGDAVELRWPDDGPWWRLRQLHAAGERWLVVRDVDAELRFEAMLLSSARCRRLADSAARLAHDLNNQFTGMLALSARLAELEVDEADEGEHGLSRLEIERATKAGARMLGALARQLTRPEPSRASVDARQLVLDSVSLTQKEFEVAEQALQITLPDGDAPVLVHVDELAAIQAIVAGLTALREAGARHVHGVLEVVRRELGSARERTCVQFGLVADDGLDAAVVAGVCETIELDQGVCSRLVAERARYEPLLVGAFVQRRAGGDLVATRHGDGLRLDYVWPAATS